MVVAISAGHHIKRQGATNGVHSEYRETVIWQAKIIHNLDLLGVDCHIVPSATLPEKVSYINDLFVDIAIEVHFNANIPNAYGCETLYYEGSERGYLLGSYIQDELVSKCNLRDRGVKVGYHKMNPANGMNYFLEKTNCPAVIIEPEFFSNYKKITDMRDEGCHAIATAIYRALEDGI